jgi:hypothetical protein
MSSFTPAWVRRIGLHDAIGYSPFGIGNVTRLIPSSTDQIPSGPVEVETPPLTNGYDVLGQLTPLILKHQGTGSIGAVSLKEGELNQAIAVGNYTIDGPRRSPRRPRAQRQPTR